MKSPMPWFCLVAAAHASLGFASENGVDAYRQGHYIQAASLLNEMVRNDPVAAYDLGRMRLYGYGVLKNDPLAMQQFEQSAEKGYLPAIRMMARYALFRQHNVEQALYWFKKAADKNDVHAQLYCAAAYLFGVGVKPNADVAKRYYILAAKNGDSIAQCTLAQSFLESHQSANKRLGLIWLNKSVEQGNPEAQVTLGHLYAEGTLVPQDFEKARALVGLAMAQHYTPAFYEMGEIARLANDVPLAKKWYTDASNAHDSKAEMALSALYMQEKSPIYDVKEGFLWMLKAAQNGRHEAQSALALMYRKGVGVEADEQLANEWQQTAVKTAQWTPKTAEMNAARWLTNGEATTLADTTYRLGGIFTPWGNANALKQNHYNQPPQMESVTRAMVYQPTFALATPESIPMIDYYNAIVSYQLAGKSNPTAEEPLVFPTYRADSKDSTAESLESLQREAMLGNAKAQYALAGFYQQGIGVPRSTERAIQYYQWAAQSYLPAAYQLSLLYLNPKQFNVEPTVFDVKTGLNLLQDTAFKGNAYAQYALGRIYEQGLQDASGRLVVQPNPSQSRAMYALAAVNQQGLAQYRLAEAMVRDKPVDESLKTAQKRTKTIKALYQGAVLNGVEAAALPLAFFNAMDADPSKQQQAFAVAKTAAQTGHLDAALLVGLMYDNGLSVEKNPSEAVHWYEQAVSNPMGAFLLGTHLSLGLGIEQDAEKGRLLLEQAAQSGFSYADFNLAMLQHQRNEAFLPLLEKAYANGNRKAGLLLADYTLSAATDDHQKMKQSRDIYQSIADLGDKQAQLKLGFMLEQGLGGPVDATGAAKWYALAAEQGQSMAQYLLGRIYQQGALDKTPNYAEATKWYRLAQSAYAPAAVALGFMEETVHDHYDRALVSYQRAASVGDANGEFNVGLLYENGKGYAVDLEKAMSAYASAAAHGHVQAMVQLAGIYLNAKQNPEQALHWYKKAADLGDRDALYQLGLLFESGVGVPLNDANALRYYQQSADLGHANAKLALARMHQYGLGVPKSPEQALTYYKELAELNNAYAQYQLGLYYLDGKAGARFVSEGKKWLKEAEKNGSPQALAALQAAAVRESNKTSFIEPAPTPPKAVRPEPSKQSVEWMYFDALSAWNRGDESFSREILSRLLAQYPDYLPAKQAWQLSRS